MSCEAVLALPDEAIDRVVFFKREDLKSDRVCCEVHCGNVVIFAHQESKSWNALLAKLEGLPGFMTDWRATIADPPFDRVEMIAFERAWNVPASGDSGDARE